jgi:hypothetical protein
MLPLTNFMKGLANYQTTVTGMAALVFAALSNAYPDYAPIFDWLRDGFALLFVVLVKDAKTGSTPDFWKPKP